MAGLLADAAEAPTTGSWGVRLRAGGGVTDVGLRELKELLVELDKIASGARRLAIAAELSRRLGSLVGPLDAIMPFRPHSLERLALLRALDHLRNLGCRGELMSLRARILLSVAGQPITYRLRTVADGSETSFRSLSREYEPADRLVRGPGQEYCVVGIEPGEPTLLLVAEWHP